MREKGRLVLVELTMEEVEYMRVLMARYANVPMDIADASLVAVAEKRNLREIFTLDSDFFIYRLSDGTTLQQYY